MMHSSWAASLTRTLQPVSHHVNVCMDERAVKSYKGPCTHSETYSNYRASRRLTTQLLPDRQGCDDCWGSANRTAVLD